MQAGGGGMKMRASANQGQPAADDTYERVLRWLLHPLALGTPTRLRNQWTETG